MAFSTQSKLYPWISIGNSTDNSAHQYGSFRKAFVQQRNRDPGTNRIQAAASPSTIESGQETVAYEEGQLERPRWTGETPLSRLVGALINFKPLYSVLKYGARQVLIR